MANTISAIIEGVEYNLQDGTLAYLVGHSGWGLAPLHRFSSRSPEQHGDTDQGFRLDPRFGTLTLQLPTSNLDDLYELRGQIQTLFAPDRPVILKWATALGNRQIDCYRIDDDNMPWDTDDWAAQTLVLTFKANDPLFYDPVGKSQTFLYSGGGASFLIPYVIPYSIGASVVDEAKTFAYAGNAPSFPDLIRLTGPMTNPVLLHETLDKTLDFTGFTIAAGDYYDIDCRFGHKTILDKAGASKINDLTNASDLDTFHIASTLESAGGINSIRLTATAITAATKAEINYFERFLGR